jgi:hypothetical protein
MTKNRNGFRMFRISAVHYPATSKGERSSYSPAVSIRSSFWTQRGALSGGRLPDSAPPKRTNLVLLDGPHAYPLPQIEFAYLFPHIKLGGWLVVDDIQIPSVYELFCFLKRESSVAMEEVAVRTAFFRRIKAAESGPDGWAVQGMNRHTILRYSWRDRLRHLLGKQ